MPAPRPLGNTAQRLQGTAVRYFLEVVRCGSISEASARLHVAGSAISRHIAQLEEVLDAALFERQGRGIRPTAAGELLALYAQKSAHDAERAVYDIRALEGLEKGRIRLAVSEGFAIEFLPGLIGAFLARHPGVQFHMGVHPPTEGTRRVLLGDADIGITMSRSVEPGVHVEYAIPCPVVAVMRPGHPLTRFRQVSIAQLQAYPLALPEANMTVRQLFDIACSRRRLHVEPVLVSNYVSALFGFLRYHDGITISGEISIRNQVDRGELAFVRLRDRGLDLRNIEVQTLAERPLSRAAQVFLDELKQALPGAGN